MKRLEGDEVWAWDDGSPFIFPYTALPEYNNYPMKLYWEDEHGVFSPFPFRLWLKSPTNMASP